MRNHFCVSGGDLVQYDIHILGGGRDLIDSPMIVEAPADC